MSQRLAFLVCVLVCAIPAAAGRLPISFEPSVPGTGSRFVARGLGYSLSINDSEAVAIVGSDVVRIGFSGAHQPSSITGEDPMPGQANYLIGSDRSKWRTGVPLFRRVVAHEVYDGIDVAYYGTGDNLEYDFIVHPGADPRQIQLSFRGAVRVEQDARGNIALHLAGGTIRQHVPVVYQEESGRRTLLPARFKKSGRGTFAFDIAHFDRTKALVIDPTLSWSALLGGGDSFEKIYGIAVDQAGNNYVTGITGSTDFPLVTPYQAALHSTEDAFVAKLDPTGTSILYATYLGGIAGDDAYGIAVNGAGEAFVTGETGSRDFPTTPGAYQVAGGFSSAGFVTKLSSSGSSLVYSALLGRSPAGDNLTRLTGIALDAAGNAHVVGGTTALDYPKTADAVPSTVFYSHYYWAVFSVLNASGTSLLYSTYLTGSLGSFGNAIAVDSSGNSYLTGTSASLDFPTTPGSFQPNAGLSGDQIVWITKFSPAYGLVYSTFLGDEGAEALAIAADSGGNAYLTGGTSSQRFPVTPGALQTSPGPFGRAFVTKLNPSGTALVYSTFLGGSRGDTGMSIAVDSAGYAYVAGYTYSADFPLKDPIQPLYIGDTTKFDAFVTKLEPDGRSLSFSTFLGGHDWDTAYGISVNAAGDDLRVAGATFSSDFPTNRTLPGNGPWKAGNSDGFIARITFSQPDLAITATHTGDFIQGMSPFTYTLAVKNVGTAPTNRTVTVIDTLPAGMTATAMSGAGWSCDLATVSCTTSATLDAGRTYPQITLTVSVGSSVLGNVGNVVRVSGGGESNASNDTATDRTIVLPNPARKRSVRHS